MHMLLRVEVLGVDNDVIALPLTPRFDFDGFHDNS